MRTKKHTFNEYLTDRLVRKVRDRVLWSSPLHDFVDERNGISFDVNHSVIYCVKGPVDDNISPIASVVRALIQDAIIDDIIDDIIAEINLQYS